MTFIEESGRRSRVYDFTTVSAPPGLQRWMAEAFARVTGPRGGAKRQGTADAYYTVLKSFAAALATATDAPGTPGEITPAHIAAFRLALAPTAMPRNIVLLRSLVRQDTDLPPDTRRAIREGRLPRRTPASIEAYTDAERQQILTAARGDIRRARDRIRAGRDLLGRYRRGELDPHGQDGRVGELLDVFDRTGDLPRWDCGEFVKAVQDVGGAHQLLPMLCLTRMEATAFAVLLVDLTGKNFGTIIDWPAVCFRPDGQLAEPAVALVEESKPRRGPGREHMVTALEDLPASLAEVLGDSEERRLFRSPLRVYLLLLELSTPARRHGGFPRVFSYVGISAGRGGRWLSSMYSFYVGTWAQAHGFPRLLPARPERPEEESSGAGESIDAGAAIGHDKPPVSTRRLRQTAIERGRRPVAHSRATMNDYYLARSQSVAQEGREIVRDALGGELAKARAAQQTPVFTPAFLQRAASDPAAAAAEMGVNVAVLRGMLAGEQDTVLAACTDHREGPYTEPGEPCDASFLDCLGCRNARALPHQLPIQVTAHERLSTLRTNLDPATWQHRYGTAFAQLTDLLGHYNPEERDLARGRVVEADQHLLDDLLDRRLDLR